MNLEIFENITEYYDNILKYNPKNYGIVNGELTEKKKGFISFSGGATSGYMLHYLLKNKSNEFNFVVVFANTGCESTETLEFVIGVEIEFGINIVWVERDFKGGLIGGHKIVNFETCTKIENWRNGKNPFEIMVKRYGLPNPQRPFTTEKLKLVPIKSYLRSIGWKDGDYYTFIGIRYDEIDRVNSRRQDLKIIYPLIEYVQWTKQHVNFWWSNKGFKLNIKGYEGNCVGCYKKSKSKLAQIYFENSKSLEFFDYLQFRYQYHIPKYRVKKIVSELKRLPKMPFTMYRDNNTLQTLHVYRKSIIKDDSEAIGVQLDLFENESCDIYSNCGD